MKQIYIMDEGCGHEDYFRQIAECCKGRYIFTNNIKEADVIIYFTCGFTKTTPFYFISALALIKKEKKENAIVIITGCGTKMYNQESLSEFKNTYVVDLKNLSTEVCNILQVPFKKGEYYLTDTSSLTLHIVRGCLKKGGYCSFCKYNYLGIDFKSLLTIKEVVDIVSKNKIKILNLSGANTTSYGLDFEEHKPQLHLLIREISKIDSLKWIAITSVASSGIYPELLEEIRNNQKVYYVNYFFQSGSQKMLNKMNIGSSVAVHKAVIAALKEKCISTAFLMCHPGEGEAELQETLSFIKAYNIWYADMFCFLRSYDTPSFYMAELPESEYWRHFVIAKELVSNLKQNFLNSLLGKKLPAFILNIRENVLFVQCLGGINACCEVTINNAITYEIADKVNIVVSGVKNYDTCLLVGEMEE